MPKVPGPCKAFMPRWWYNAKTGKCEKFIYGGCQGNANNFKTEEECMETCPVKCPPLPCDVKCEYGHVLDKNGCPTCECIEPCKVSCFSPKENKVNLFAGMKIEYDGYIVENQLTSTVRDNLCKNGRAGWRAGGLAGGRAGGQTDRQTDRQTHRHIWRGVNISEGGTKGRNEGGWRAGRE